MASFDAPNREQSCARRGRSNTPLQALLLLNDPQYVECAQGLADRVLREGGHDAKSRAAYMLRLCTSRKPDESEVAELLSVIEDLTRLYSKDPDAAANLVSQLAAARATPGRAAELAAWTMAANLVLNLDEVLTKG